MKPGSPHLGLHSSVCCTSWPIPTILIYTEGKCCSACSKISCTSFELLLQQGGGGRWVREGGRAGKAVLEESGFQSCPGALQLSFPEAFLKPQFPCQNSEVQASGRFVPVGLCG